MTINTSDFDIKINSIIDGGSGSISTGFLKKTGSGTLKLSAANLFSGGTNVDEGLLLPLNNSALGTGNILIGGQGSAAQMQINSGINLSNTVTVESQGVFYGVGEVGTTVVNSGGKIQAGLTEHDIGKLTIRGDLNLNSGAIFHAQLATDGSYDSDLLLVYGNATLNGASLYYSDIGANYEYGKYYTVIDSLDSTGTGTGTIVGTLSVTGNSPFLSFSGKIDSSNGGIDNIYVIGAFRNNVNFSDYALTPNQKSTAISLDNLNTNGQLDNYAAGLSGIYIRNAFDLLSGEIHAALRSSLLGWSQNTSQSSLDQLRSRLGQPANDCASDAPTSSSHGSECKHRPPITGWAQVVGNWSQTSGDGNAAQSKTNTGGLLLGAGYGLGGSGWRIGSVFGYGKTTVKSNPRRSSADLHNYTLGVHAGKRFDWGVAEHVNVMAGISYTHHAIKTDRLIPRLNQALKAKYNGNTVQAFGEVGYAMAPIGQWGLEPFVGLNVSKQKVDSFEETGGFAGVRSNAESKTYATAMLGLHAQSNMKISGKAMQLRGTVGLKQSLGNKDITRTMAFNQGSPDYLIWGVPRSSSTMVLGIQAQMALSSNATLEAVFNGEFGKKVREQAIQARVRLAF